MDFFTDIYFFRKNKTWFLGREVKKDLGLNNINNRVTFFHVIPPTHPP